MATVIKGNFRMGAPKDIRLPKGIDPNTLTVGSVVPPEALAQIEKEHEASLKMNFSDPSRVRPFIDQPMVEGTIPSDPKAREIVLSRLVHEYRNANPRVIGAGAIAVPDMLNSDDVSYLTNIYYQCQTGFNRMISEIREGEYIPASPRFDSLTWENVAFPRLANNLHILRAVLLYVEQEETGLIFHIVFVYSRGEATVFSTRYPL